MIESIVSKDWQEGNSYDENLQHLGWGEGSSEARCQNMYLVTHKISLPQSEGEKNKQKTTTWATFVADAPKIFLTLKQFFTPSWSALYSLTFLLFYWDFLIIVLQD